MIKAKKEKLCFDVISCDTTSNCNIRCKFCFNDWKRIGPNINMSKEIFLKLIELLPLARENSFFLSCLYEPFINKDFVDYLSFIPDIYREKCFFTTNLTTPLSKEQIEKLSIANVDHINISLESLNENTYNSLCEHSNYNIFYNNLTRLTDVFKNAEKPPKLHYISMILKDNYYELPLIAYRCKNEFNASLNEFRTPYVGPNMRLEWLDNQILSKKELSDLKGLICSIGAHTAVDITTNTDNYSKVIQAKRNRDEEKYVLEEATNRYFELRVNSSGIVHVYAQNKDYDLQNIDNPYAFFNSILKQLHIEKAKDSERSFNLFEAEQLSSDLFCIDRCTGNEVVLNFEGWAAIEGQNMSEFKKHIVVYADDIMKIYEVKNTERLDVAMSLGSDIYKMSGFQGSVIADGLPNSFKVMMLFIKDNKMFIKHFEDSFCY